MDLSTFNAPQRDAVEYCSGPSLVIAGAGSGKTRVLTYKIAYLMENGYEPWSILALTFTNKAANEMKQRIARIVGDERARYLWMGTFHSIFLRILRTEHEAIGFSSNFTIYDTADSKSLVKAIIKEMALDDKVYKPGNILSQISNAKNHLITAGMYAENTTFLQIDERNKVPKLCDIYKRYSNRCKQADAMDFDDILVYTYMLFEQHPDIRQKYVERFAYVLVDEYQDTNYAQHQIVHQLTRERQRVCVVGDDAQSIYSFRGANIDNILKFKDFYPEAQLFKLEQNYRSTQTIVNAANSLIKKNRGQIQKDVFSEKDQGEQLTLSEAYSDIEEAQIVCRQIQHLRRSESLEYSDFAILYRTNAQSRVFEETLRKQGLPYHIYGGLSFYQRKEIKDVIAYFRLAVNPNDEEALKRVINYPARGIGNTTLQKIIDAAVQYNVSLWTVIATPLHYGISLTKGTATKIQGFHDLIESFIDLAQQVDAEKAGREIIQKSGIIGDLYQDSSPENLARQENLEELVNGLADFVQGRTEEDNPNVSISDYLSEVSLLSDVDTDKGGDEHKITLMTIHSAKGLEFNTVFIVGLEENLFPSQMSGTSPREMEEERRLFYVAITRAEKHCFLSYAKSRLRYGKMEFSTQSRFISDIDPCYLRSQSSMRASHKASASDDVQLPWMRKQSPPSFQGSNYGNSSWDHTPSRPQPRPVPRFEPPTPAIRNLKPINRAVQQPAPAAPIASASSSGLSIGARVQHQRFGQGTVMQIDGKDESTKATIRFDNAGVKQLLLKFAKLTIL